MSSVGSTSSVSPAANFHRSAVGRVLWLLTTVAVALEIGLAVRLLDSHSALWTVGLVLAAFHTGYLLAGTAVARTGTKIPVPLRSATLALAGVLLVVGTLRGLVILLALGAFIFSSAVQRWRRELKPLARPRAAVKNAGKAIGMLAASLFALPPVASAGAVAVLTSGIVVMSLVTPAFAPSPKIGTVLERPRTETRLLLWSEGLHHAHYFAYAYTFWVLLSLPAALIGPSFIIGWLGYFAAERWLREYSRFFSPWWFVGGHVLCACALTVIALRFGTPESLLAWGITGVGGGTAYMLGNASAAAPPRVRERYEDVGHVGGCVIASITAAIAYTAPVVAGIVLALGAASAMLLYVCRPAYKETCP
jgi:hypothetical protein